MRWLKIWISLIVGLLLGWIVTRFFLDRRQSAPEEAVSELHPAARTQLQNPPAADASVIAGPESKAVEQEPIDQGETGEKEPVEPDDLRKIEGIGPKISNILHENGIDTFAQLAGTDVDDLRAILSAAGPRFRLANPTTWPQQAKLAAADDWEGLRTLQNELKHGR